LVVAIKVASFEEASFPRLLSSLGVFPSVVVYLDRGAFQALEAFLKTQEILSLVSLEVQAFILEA